MMNRFLSLVAGFAFTSREYILQHLPMTALKHKNNIFNNYNTNDKSCNRINFKRYLMNRSGSLLLKFLFLYAKDSLNREIIVVLLNKTATICF